ncbi:hypothetical protein HD806DRAFT_514077 [Xylariaceae sp. AK1471]|nr:hypothetical protein HD806DRAFT_514077 [Xylariaceae sp. AK1471]
MESAAWGYTWDRYNANQRLATDSERLFSKKTDRVEYFLGPDTTNPAAWDGPQEQTVKGEDLCLPIPQVRHRLTSSHNPVSLTYYDSPIIKTYSSGGTWGRFHISRQTFFKLLSSMNAFAYFMRTVHSFGYRISDGDDTWDNFHWRSSGVSKEIFEICYTVRFYERHGRGGQNPWSLRQAGLYQRVLVATQQASWILIQYSDTVKDAVVEKLERLTRDSSMMSQRQVLLHLAILTSSLQNWDEYFKYQAEELEKLEDKAYFLKLDQNDPFDYRLSFTDRQNLQILRCDLMKAHAILQSSLSIGKFMRLLYSDSSTLGITVPDEIILEVDDYIEETKYYQSCVSSLLDRSKEVATLLSTMLEYRTGKSTLAIAEQGELESKITQKVSNNIRALTIVATLYLPASLLASIFSSSLVQPQSIHEEYTPTRFVVAPDFWKFVVVLLPLLLVTFAVVVVLQIISTYSHKRDLEAAKQEKTNRLPP